jgi:hypothetical protein
LERNGAIISPARLDRSWLINYLSEAGSNVSEKNRAVRITELGHRELKRRLGVSCDS